jgi:hypothetical protein
MQENLESELDMPMDFTQEQLEALDAWKTRAEVIDLIRVTKVTTH